MGNYRVKWEIDVEDIADNPIEAMRDAHQTLMGAPNEWVWHITDKDTGKEYRVDAWTDDREPVVYEVIPGTYRAINEEEDGKVSTDKGNS